MIWPIYCVTRLLVLYSKCTNKSKQRIAYIPNHNLSKYRMDEITLMDQYNNLDTCPLVALPVSTTLYVKSMMIVQILLSCVLVICGALCLVFWLRQKKSSWPIFKCQISSFAKIRTLCKYLNPLRDQA